MNPETSSRKRTRREKERERAQSRCLYTLISPSDDALRQYKQMLDVRTGKATDKGSI